MIITIRKIPFENILRNLKHIEIRLLKPPFNQLRVNDKIIFIHGIRKITKKIKNIKIYDSFENIYELEMIDLITPQFTSISKENFVNYYNTIYKKYNIQNFKIIAIFID